MPEQNNPVSDFDLSQFKEIAVLLDRLGDVHEVIRRKLIVWLGSVENKSFYGLAVRFDKLAHDGAIVVSGRVAEDAEIMLNALRAMNLTEACAALDGMEAKTRASL